MTKLLEDAGMACNFYQQTLVNLPCKNVQRVKSGLRQEAKERSRC